MGVADNRSYKDEYHFQNDGSYEGREKRPSVAEDPKINSTIKENPYRSNVEIEGGEIVLQPDLTALFKAVGKKHSRGGMNVLLKPESFIFSDFKGLSFKKKEYETFELKEPSSKKDPQKHTPAEVLKKNVDIKHYNKLVDILDDPYKDDLAKKSATMMLEKYIQSLGNIAYVQEEKKKFPQGIPGFALGTAPVYDPEIKAEIMENKQYMRAGGLNNPYMQRGGRSPMTPPAQTLDEMWKQALQNPPATTYPNSNGMGRGWQNAQNPNTVITPQPQNPQTRAQAAAWGLWQGDKMPIFQDRYGMTNAADKFDDLKDWNAVASELGYKGPKDNLAFQKWLYNDTTKENRAIIDKWHGEYSKGPNAGMFDSKIGIRWANAVRDIREAGKRPVRTAKIPGLADTTPNPVVKAPEMGLNVPNVDVQPQGSKQADWRFTPWQKISQLNNAMQFANVKRYMPYRSRYNATYVDPALVNPEQAVGDVQANANQQLSSLTTLNPLLRNAQAASIAGQVMNQLPGVRSQYDNQNAQILNQARQYNNQTKNNESMINMGNDQNYYREAVEGRKNFDNMRTHTWNNYMNNVLRDVETNQKLAYNLLTQDKPAYGFDWRTGNFTRNAKNILDVQGSATNERYNDLIQMVSSISDPVKKAELMVKLEGLKVFGSAQQNPSPFGNKKGGTVRRKKNPY